MKLQRRIALVAHDEKKADLIKWAKNNKDFLASFQLCGTGSTGYLLEKELQLPITRLESGPLGGDQQLGAMIVDGKIDLLIFFWDPLESQPHDPDVRALLRIAVVWNLPIACNPSTADLIIGSSLMQNGYTPEKPDYQNYRKRLLKE